MGTKHLVVGATQNRNDGFSDAQQITDLLGMPGIEGTPLDLLPKNKEPVNVAELLDLPAEQAEQLEALIERTACIPTAALKDAMADYLKAGILDAGGGDGLAALIKHGRVRR